MIWIVAETACPAVRDRPDAATGSIQWSAGASALWAADHHSVVRLSPIAVERARLLQDLGPGCESRLLSDGRSD